MELSKIASYGVLLALVSLWWIIAATGIVDSIILPSPSAVAGALPAMIAGERFASDVWLTLMRVAKALAIAIMIGVPAGLFLGYKRSVYRAIEGPLHALRSVPATALFPLFLLVVGIGEASIVALAAYPSLLVILVNSVSGATLSNQRRLHHAKSLRLSPVRIITDVLFWEALPSVLEGVRIAASYALVLVIAVEMFIGIGSGGVGRRIFDYQATYRIPETYAAICTAALIGIAMNYMLNRLEQRSLHWLPGRTT